MPLPLLVLSIAGGEFLVAGLVLSNGETVLGGFIVMAISLLIWQLA